MPRRRIPRSVQLLEKARREPEVDKIVDEPGRVGYIIYKPKSGKRRILVFRRLDREQLKQPVEAWVPADLSETDLAVVDYIIQAVCRRTPRLLPFALENQSIRKMCRYLLLYRSGSIKTLWSYIYCLHNLFKHFGKDPDDMIAEASRDPNKLKHHAQLLEEYLLLLKTKGASSSYISAHAKSMKTLYRVNGLRLELNFPLKNVNKYHDRAPKPEELQKLLEYASLREKVIISMLALGGFRLGTLVCLKYRHVKRDLEAGVTPIHIHVEADITKGKYCDYDTFIGNEAAEFLRLYLERRRRRGEAITDDSPLIATEHNPGRRLSENSIYKLIHRLYLKAGLISKGERMHELRVHSLRKYFRTQLTARGVPSDYVEYMMGHKTDRYNDIKSLGVEFLRNLYKLADLSIRPKPLTKDQIVKIFEQAIADIARRAGVSLGQPSIEPAAYVQEPEPGFEKLSLELEAILKHMIAKMLEQQSKS